MGLIEEDHQFRFGQVSFFRHFLEDLSQQAEHEGAEHRRIALDIGHSQYVDHSAALVITAHQVVDVERGFPEEAGGSLLFQTGQAAHDNPGRGGLEKAVFLLEFRLPVFLDIFQHGFQVLDVEQRQPFVVAVFEDHGEDPGLVFVEIEYFTQENRAEFRDGSFHFHSLFVTDGHQFRGVPPGLPVEAYQP